MTTVEVAAAVGKLGGFLESQYGLANTLLLLCTTHRAATPVLPLNLLLLLLELL